MAYSDDFDDARRIIDRIDYSVVADSDSPKIFLGHQLPSGMRTRFIGQTSKRTHNAIPRELIKRPDLFLCGTLEACSVKALILS